MGTEAEGDKGTDGDRVTEAEGDKRIERERGTEREREGDQDIRR